MSTRDFVAIARGLHGQYRLLDTNERYLMHAFVERLCTIFGGLSPRFDPKKFRMAVYEGEGL